MRISIWHTASEQPSGEGYEDIFDPHSSHLQPVSLDDGTSIAWPPGWSQKDADLWRRATGLVRPDCTPALSDKIPCCEGVEVCSACEVDDEVLTGLVSCGAADVDDEDGVAGAVSAVEDGVLGGEVCGGGEIAVTTQQSILATHPVAAPPSACGSAGCAPEAKSREEFLPGFSD